jgi:hypothetical protein
MEALVFVVSLTAMIFAMDAVARWTHQCGGAHSLRQRAFGK